MHSKNLDGNEQPENKKTALEQSEVVPLACSIHDEARTKMQYLLNLGEDEQKCINCFGSVQFITGNSQNAGYEYRAHYKGNPTTLTELLQIKPTTPFGIQFVGQNRRYEDNYDEVGFLEEEEVLHELIAIKSLEDDYQIFEKPGAQAAQINTLKASLEYYQELVEEGVISLRIFSVS